MKKYRCSICGNVSNDNVMCPICGCDSSYLEEFDDEENLYNVNSDYSHEEFEIDDEEVNSSDAVEENDSSYEPLFGDEAYENDSEIEEEEPSSSEESEEENPTFDEEEFEEDDSLEEEDNDDESFKEFIDNAEVILVDNAFDFDINKWEEDYQKELEEELDENNEETESSTEISNDDIDKKFEDEYTKKFGEPQVRVFTSPEDFIKHREEVKQFINDFEESENDDNHEDEKDEDLTKNEELFKLDDFGSDEEEGEENLESIEEEIPSFEEFVKDEEELLDDFTEDDFAELEKLEIEPEDLEKPAISEKNSANLKYFSKILSYFYHKDIKKYYDVRDMICSYLAISTPVEEDISNLIDELDEPLKELLKQFKD